MLRSSRGLGYCPFTAGTPVRIRYGVPFYNRGKVNRCHVSLISSKAEFNSLSRYHFAWVARIVRQRTANPFYAGANPVPSSNTMALVAQLVEPQIVILLVASSSLVHRPKHAGFLLGEDSAFQADGIGSNPVFRSILGL